MTSWSKIESFFIQASSKRQGRVTNTENHSLFTILHQNVQSILNKIDDLTIFLEDCKNKYDVIAVTEHWLNISQISSIKIPNYTYSGFFLRKRNYDTWW